MNVGPEMEDRGVEGAKEEIVINGEEVEIQDPPTLDALGNPAAPEDDMGHN